MDNTKIGGTGLHIPFQISDLVMPHLTGFIETSQALMDARANNYAPTIQSAVTSLSQSFKRMLPTLQSSCCTFRPLTTGVILEVDGTQKLLAAWALEGGSSPAHAIIYQIPVSSDYAPLDDLNKTQFIAGGQIPCLMTHEASHLTHGASHPAPTFVMADDRDMTIFGDVREESQPQASIDPDAVAQILTTIASAVENRTLPGTAVDMPRIQELVAARSARAYGG